MLSTQGYVFRIWFQIGSTTSDWHGVEYINSSPPITGTVDFSPVSSTNTVFTTNTNFDNDSEFRG